MALDLAMLRKLAAASASKGKQPPAKGGKEPPEPEAPKEAPGKPGNGPAVNPFVAAAAKAKERLLAAK